MTTETVSQMREQLASQDAEIAELRQRIAALEQWVAELRRPVPANVAAPPPRPAEGEGVVQIYYPAATARIALPTDAELAKLIAIALREHPHLAPDTRNPRWADQNAADFHREFCDVFRIVSALNREDNFGPRTDARRVADGD